MLKNVATKLLVYCWDATTGLPKTGDAANLTAYVSLDFDTSPDAITDTSATELSNTNAKGFYMFDLAQGETNGDYNLYTCKSSTSNVVCMCVPCFVHTLPTTGILAPATAGRTLVVDASGLADANMVKLGPTGSGTAQTARDIGAGVNVTQYGGVNGTFSGGRPEVNASHAGGTAWGSGAITAAAFANDSITNSAIADDAFDSSAVATNAVDKIAAPILLRLSGLVNNYNAGSFPTIGDTGNDTTHVHIPDLTFGDDEINGYMLVIYDNSENEHHVRKILDWVNSTKLATVDTLPFTPQDSTDYYWLQMVDADLTGSGPSAATIADAVWEEALADHEGTAGSTAEALATAGGSGASAADIADAVWDEACSGHTTNGTYGKAFTGATNVFLAAGIAGTINTLDALDTAQDSQHSTTQSAIAALNNITAASVWAVGTRSLTVLDEDSTTMDLDATIRAAVGLVSANLDTQIGDLPTNAELATSQAAADDATLAAIAALTIPTAAQIRSEIDSNSTQLAAIVADTNELQTDWANGGRLDLLVDAILDDTGTSGVVVVGSSVRTAVGLASANLDTQLAAIAADNPNRPTRGVQLDDLMFTMVDETDFNTPETGVTVTAQISKDGGAFSGCSNSVTEVSAGFYKLTLTASEMTANSIALKMTGTGCAQRNFAFRTQPT